MKTILGILAVLFIIVGFGIIHASFASAETIGGGLIGLGSLYLILLLKYGNKNPK